MTKSIDFNGRDYECLVEIDGQHYDLGAAPTVGQGDVKCNLFLIEYYEIHNAPELAAELVLANLYAGYA